MLFGGHPSAPGALSMEKQERNFFSAREIVHLFEHGTQWTMRAIPHGGHMAPLTHPEVVLADCVAVSPARVPSRCLFMP